MHRITTTQGSLRTISNYRADDKRYAIAHNRRDVYHLIELDRGRYLSTGQPHLEIFDTIEEANEFLKGQEYRGELFGERDDMLEASR